MLATSRAFESIELALTSQQEQRKETQSKDEAVEKAGANR